MYAVYCNFLHCAGICDSVRDFQSKLHFRHFPTNITRPYLPVFLVTLVKNRSGATFIYDQLSRQKYLQKQPENGRLN